MGSWGSDQSYGLGSEVARLETIAYYVGQGENGSPSLFQLRLQRTDATTSSFQPEELVEGVDSLQVRYGLDTDSDRQVNTWQTADEVAAANNWGVVLSVEITLLARASEEHGTDRRQRHLQPRRRALRSGRRSPLAPGVHDHHRRAQPPALRWNGQP